MLSLFCKRLWNCNVNVLHSWGPFMVAVLVSRCLHVRGSCRVPLSVLFDPPVTSRASLVQKSWRLVAISGVMWSMVSPVGILLISALVRSEVIVSTAVVFSCHFPRQKKNNHVFIRQINGKLSYVLLEMQVIYVHCQLKSGSVIWLVVISETETWREHKQINKIWRLRSLFTSIFT